MNLKAYLANSGLTMRQFSKLVDCTPTYISAIASNSRVPGRRLARDIEIATNGIITFERQKKKAEKIEVSA